MPRTTRLTHALFGRKSLAALGAAAALAGTGISTAGAASAATTHHAPAVTDAVTTAAITHHGTTTTTTAPSAESTGGATLATTTGTTTLGTGTGTLNTGPGHSPLAPHAPATHTTTRTGSTGSTSTGSTSTAPAAAPQAAPAAQHTTPAAPATPAQPYQMYDSVTPSQIPGGHPIATYADGPYQASGSSVAGKNVTWIDTNGSDPHANVLDVEPGDATPASAGTWAWHKLSADPNSTAILYTMRSEWAAVQDSVHQLPAQMQTHVKYWIADPTGIPHVVPGSDATQWYWGPNYDISTVNPGF